MRSTAVVFGLLLLVWSSSALPCDDCNGTGAEVIGEVSPPEEVVVVALSDGGEFISDIPDDAGSADSEPSEEVDDSSDNDGGYSVALCESNPETCGPAPQIDGSSAEVLVAPEIGVTANA